MSNSPFFSNFIETQVEELTAEEVQQCSGGTGFAAEIITPPIEYVTMKHPSDSDEGYDSHITFEKDWGGNGPGGTCPGMNPTDGNAYVR